ncbi:hypothetical protein D3C87_1174610 [compost metagenome]
MAVDRGRRLGQEALEQGDGLVRRAFGLEFGGHQRGGFEVGLDAQRLVQLGQRAGVVAGCFLGAGEGQVRLGEFGVVGGHALEHGHGAGRVAGARDLLLHLQDGFRALARGRAGQLLHQQRLGLVPAAVQHQQGGEHLPRGGRGGRQFGPEPGGVQRLLRNPRVERDFRGALGQARVARLAREVHVGAVGGADQATLERDLGRQHPVEDVWRQRHIRQRRARRAGLGQGGRRRHLDSFFIALRQPGRRGLRHGGKCAKCKAGRDGQRTRMAAQAAGGACWRGGKCSHRKEVRAHGLKGRTEVRHEIDAPGARGRRNG